MATKKKPKGDPAVAVSAIPAEKPAKGKARKDVPAVHAAPALEVAPIVEAPAAEVAAPLVVPVAEVVVAAPRPTRQQIAARAFWHFHHGSRDTLGNWLRAEREMADVVSRGQTAPTDRWIRDLAER